MQIKAFEISHLNTYIAKMGRDLSLIMCSREGSVKGFKGLSTSVSEAFHLDLLSLLQSMMAVAGSKY